MDTPVEHAIQLKSIALELLEFVTINNRTEEVNSARLQKMAIELFTGLAELEKNLLLATTSSSLGLETRRQKKKGRGGRGCSPRILDEKDEVKKIERKLPRWASNPTQTNSRILRAYLTLEERNGQDGITVKMLEEEYEKQGGKAPFHSNFVQMKIIAPKNHGKIFEVNGEVVSIWPKVSDLVNKYKNQIKYEGES